MSSMPESVEVTIIGGGPVGLVLGLALQRMKVSTCIVERTNKPNVPMYGRACSLYPRTIEMLEQLEILDEFNQIGFIGRSSVSYKDGKRITSRSFQNFFNQLGNSYHDYCLNIRLKYSEDILRDAYVREGGKYVAKLELKELGCDPNAPAADDDGHGNEDEGFPVSAVIKAVDSDDTHTITSKFLVGADGSHSAVRTLSNIPSDSEPSPYHWVRIDGHVRTNMPDAHLGFGSIESATQGNVLYVNLDHGATRIGFALDAARYAQYQKTATGGASSMTQDQAVAEAARAMAPFSLAFDRVDWFTVYSIRESIAATYSAHAGRVFLAGDACHTHSSGAAQGMNTGVHDAVNLAWKLGGRLRGFWSAGVLRTYEEERRPVAQRVIDSDRELAALISGDVPAKYRSAGVAGGVEAAAFDPNEAFARVTAENAQFTAGLGVHYAERSLITRPAIAGGTTAGWRAPDALVYPPGVRVPFRLLQVMPNRGRFWVLVFAGEPALTKGKVDGFREYFNGEGSFKGWVKAEALGFITVIKGVKNLASEALGGEAFGRVVYDATGEAHGRYGVGEDEGAVVVVRPDGILGCAVPLDRGGEVGEYFNGFVA